jgi:sulfur-oxidizing protein SoxB
LDLDVRAGELKGYRFKLIPVFSDSLAADAEMAAKIGTVRAPYVAMMREVIGRTDTLLYRRGNFGGTLDEVICESLLSERDAEIALSPGFRWGASLLPGQEITCEDVYNATAITYPAAYRLTMTGSRLKEVLEDVADNLFNPDPYYKQGGDMVRAGGISYTINVGERIGKRISDLRLYRSGELLDADKNYIVTGWASVNEGTEGPPVWDLVMSHVRQMGVVAPRESNHVRVIGT